MGSAVKRLIPAFAILFLCGCTQVVEIPYVLITEGVYACGDAVWENGTVRSRAPTDVQALQFIPDGSGINLTKSTLVDYTGTLYSLSNYRSLLLANGYVVEKETRTSSLLDTTLSGDGDRVRLIYQAGGRIRILFENSEGVAHILLEGI